MLLVVAFVLTATACGAGDPSFIAQYPSDTIKILWYALGLIASFVSLILGGIGVWSLKKIMQHDKDIVAIKTGCKGHMHRRAEDED